MKRFKEPCQLHNHSKYSLLDAVPSFEEWVAWCLETKTPGIAVTDHGNAISLFYATRVKKMIEDYNKDNETDYPTDTVVGVPGVELYVKLDDEVNTHHHITAWAVTNEGYANLMKLSSVAFQDQVKYYGSIKARVTIAQIKEYSEGVIFGTACIASPMGSAIMNDDYETAEQIFKLYHEVFGEGLHVEFHPTDLTHDFNKKTGGFDPFPPSKLAPDGNQQK